MVVGGFRKVCLIYFFQQWWAVVGKQTKILFLSSGFGRDTCARLSCLQLTVGEYGAGGVQW